MKKLYSLLVMLIMAVGVSAQTSTLTLNGSEVSEPEGYFTHDTDGKFNFNNKFKDAEYAGITFTKGLKMEGSTKVLFTSAKGPSTVTIVQSTWAPEGKTVQTIKFDGTELAVDDAEPGTGCLIYTLANVGVGNHAITRGSGEAGIFYVKVVTTDTQDDAFKALIKAAEDLVDESAVAVAKLKEAIDAAKIAAGTDADKAALQAAIDQFKADNADQESDQTAKVKTEETAWQTFNGGTAGKCDAKFAPMVTTYDGRGPVNLAEMYQGDWNGGPNTTGDIIWQDISGLENGSYKVGFYANAFFTPNRNMVSEMEDGAMDVAYVFANEKKAFIVSKIAESTTENGFYTFDVDVKDGKIKLGLGKDKAGTNWHTIQIYQLTWFTTAKEVYAKDQQELSDLIAEAKKLTGENGKAEFEEALATAEEATDAKKDWYNIKEIEQIISDLKAAMKAYKRANIVIPEGKYYLVAMELEDNNLMAAGKSWGTRGIVNDKGLDLNFIYNDATENYFIETNVYNGSDNHFLGENLFMDSPAYGWNITEDEVYGHNIWVKVGEAKKYLGVNANSELALVDAPYAWGFFYADQWEKTIKEEGLEAMKEATKDKPVDATFLLKDPQFNRNDHRWEAWTVSDDCTNVNLGGGCDENIGNGCAESFHSVFTISQTIKGAPAGVYKMTAQGFYRQDDGMEEDIPFFFIGENKCEIGLRTGTENNMTQAGASFEKGVYTIEPIEFVLDEDGDITVGVKGTAVHQWVIFDNFQMTYLGPKVAETAAISDKDKEAPAAGVYPTITSDVKLLKGLNTLVLPFTTTAAELGAKRVLKYDGTTENGKVINFSTVTELAANTPYCVFMDADKTLADFKDKTVVEPTDLTVADNNYSFVGTYTAYAKGESPIAAGDFIAGEKGFVKANGGNAIAAYRAYLKKGAGDPAPTFCIDGEFVDGIEAIEMAAGLTNSEIYNLNGQRVNKAQKGIYIINGKKVAVK